MRIPQIDPATERYEALNILLQTNIPNLTSGVEVGVRHGVTAKYLLEHNPNLYLTLVDPYSPYQDIHEYLDIKAQEAIKANAIKNLELYEDRIRWLFSPSNQAWARVLSNTQDFVFIDGNHTEEDVLGDCNSWYLAVKPGGILCGHDYCYDPVKRGLARFTTIKGKPDVHRLQCEGDIWVIEKI